jgi:pimeloyl-ACP methyl ester carboxylesterase
VSLAHDDSGGAGPALLLVHGFSVDRRCWDAVLPALAARHRVVRCELRGFGATPPPDGPYAHAEDLRALLGELGLGPVTVVGLSLGATVALDLAVTHPQLVAALVLAGAMPAGGLEGELLDGARRVSRLARDGDLDAARAAWLEGPLLAPADGPTRAMVGDYSGWHWAHRDPAAPLAERPADVRRPALVLVGEHETPQFRAHAERLARELPEARLQTVAGAGHLVPGDNPEAFAALTLRFVGGLEKRS